MPKSRLSTKLWLLFGLSWVFALGSATILISRLEGTASLYRSMFEQDVHFADSTRLMQVTFKKQVQEWKDALLRGYDPDALRKHREAFEDNERKVDQLAFKLTTQATDTRTQELLTQFAQAHSQMAAKYRTALAAFVEAKGETPRIADQMVKGQDRAPTDLIDKLVEHTVQRIALAVANQDASITRDVRMTIVLSALCFIPLVVLSIGVVRRMTRTLEWSMQMTASMQAIHAAGGKISKILRVIDEIAFQTNILALNAAVEAARAGAAGVEFAVVADEVRELARRCAEAARDTDGLIEESAESSREGSSKLSEVATVFSAIAESAVRVRDLVAAVDDGSQEQVRGVEQIGRGLLETGQVAQRCGTNAEENAAASEEMQAQADALQEIVGRLSAMMDGSA